MANMPMDDETRKKMFEDMVEAMKAPITPLRWDIHPLTKLIRPETDEEGNIYGYKVLIWDVGRGQFLSPVYPAYWSYQFGELTADKNPGRTESHGIYFLKSGDDPELVGYYRQAEYRAAGYRANKVFVVRCMLFGTIVEAERGFRVEHARIEGVGHNGNWQTYQNFREEAEAYYRRRYEEPRYTYQDWEKITRYEYTARDTDPLPRMASTDEDSTAD